MIYDVPKPESGESLLMMCYVNSIPSVISEEVIRQVLWHYGQPEGWRPGTFTETLLSAFGKADNQNFKRLSHGFPEYAYAVFMCQAVQGGTDTFRSLLKKPRND